MPNGRAIAVIVAALACCSAATRAAEPLPAPARASVALPEPRALALLAAGLAGLAAIGRKRER